MMVVLQFHGVPFGPRLFVQDPLLAYGVIMSMFVAYVFMLVTLFPLTRYLSRITVVANYYMAPMIVAFTLVGAFVPRNFMADLTIAVVFGLIGYVARKTGYNVAAILIGVILGPASRALVPVVHADIGRRLDGLLLVRDRQHPLGAPRRDAAGVAFHQPVAPNAAQGRYLLNQSGVLNMRLVTVEVGDRQLAAVETAEGIIALADLAKDLPASVLEVVRGGAGALRRISAALEAGSARPLEAGSYRLLAPIPRPAKNIFCVGKNYVEHAKGVPGLGVRPELGRPGRSGSAHCLYQGADLRLSGPRPRSFPPMTPTARSITRASWVS